MVNPTQERNVTTNWKARAQKRSCSDELLEEFQQTQKMRVRLQRSLRTLSTEEQRKVRSSATKELLSGSSAPPGFLLFYSHFSQGILLLGL